MCSKSKMATPVVSLPVPAVVGTNRNTMAQDSKHGSSSQLVGSQYLFSFQNTLYMNYSSLIMNLIRK
jgi:hypothetical protein